MSRYFDDDDTDERPEYLLTKFFECNGYIRLRNAERAKQFGQKYKKGYEIRFVAKTPSELKEIRRLIERVGFKLCRPFKKNRRWVQPVYGKQAVEKFLSWIRESKKRKNRAVI